MKKSNAYVSGLILASTTILFSCEKTDLAPAEVTELKKQAANCEITAFRYTQNGSTAHYVFKRETDPSTGKLKQITAGISQGGAITSSIVLDVHWSANTITFLRAGSLTDTVLRATVNAQGKPTQIVGGNSADASYLPTLFEYNNNRLAAMKISLAGKQLISRFNYDNKDNCVLIQDEAQGSEIPGRVEYSYDNKKAKGQLYLDEPRPFSWNSFSLLQYSGLFPELQPTQLRSSVKVYWGNNYKAYDAQIVNHQVSGGTLQKYDVTFPGSSVNLPYFVDWTCDSDASRN